MAPPYFAGQLPTGIDVELITGEWNVEKDKSSDIIITPATGMITKVKNRTFDATVREVYATLVLGGILNYYGELFAGHDFTFYSPQTLAFEYGSTDDKKNRTSRIHQFFCPGTPLNKISNSRQLEYMIADTPVTVSERVMYLMGMLTELFLHEGIIHGDPQLRHFFFLPKQGWLLETNRDGNIRHYSSRNGLAVIDCEKVRMERPYSANVTADVEKLKARVFRKFGHRRGEAFFNLGKKLVETTSQGVRARPLVEAVMQHLYLQRFPQSNAQVNLRTGKVTYK